tara:strand:+ start:3978 stop:4781 length:804 start_codon:yes stop_codon:yes gene_type:complete
MENIEIMCNKKDIKGNNKVVGMAILNDLSRVDNAEGNRQLYANTLRALDISKEESGSISAITVVKSDNSKYDYICIDGQHRVKNAKDNNDQISAIIVKPTSSTNKAMKNLNIYQFKWRPIDYLNNGIEYHKNQNYVFLEEVMIDNEFKSPIALYEIFAIDTPLNTLKLLFENGQWKATTKDVGFKTLECAEKLFEHAGLSYALSSDFMRGLAHCVNKPRFDADHLLKQVKKFKHHMHICKNPSGYRESLNNIYNRHTVSDEQVVLTK